MNSKSQNKRSLLRSFALVFLFFTGSIEAVQKLEEKPLVVLITSYNNQAIVRKNLNSVFAQNYSNYRVIYIDDCSTDNTQLMVNWVASKSPNASRMTYIRNPSRIGALANIYYAVHSCKDEEIIVSLDGDDWFASEEVLNKINGAYACPNVWLTHGSLIEFPNASSAWSIPIPRGIIATSDFRSYRCPSHLRTFYAWLFKEIEEEDLKYEGEFFPMTWDQAMMFPMIEMAGERHQFIPDTLYVYNVANTINDNKVNPQLQRDLEKYIRSMPRYHRLQKSPLE